MKLRIKDIREDRDIPQKTVCAYLQCDQSLYSKYEREERALPLKYAIMLAEFFNTSVDYLIGLTDEITPYPRSK